MPLAKSQMSTVQPPQTTILGRALIGIESIYDSIRSRLTRRLMAVYRSRWSFPVYSQSIRSVLGKSSILLANHFRDTFLATWVAGVDSVFKQFPPWLAKEFETTIRQPKYTILPPSPPNIPRITFYEYFDDDSGLRLPLIEKAAQRLSERNILTREQFDSVDKYAREQAFTITADLETDAIESIRNLLVNDLEEGTSLVTFEERLSNTIEGSKLGPAHVETIYRTNVQAAFRDGRESLANNPIVAEVFPYQQYYAVHDARARHDHTELEKLGLNGTGIYRRDDPVWEYFTPPWDFNCRCSTTLLTVEAAASRGVQEAKRWLREGPPAQPEHRIEYVLAKIQPNPGFGSRGLVGV